jgi:penicillin-binding protein 1A
MSCAGKSGTTSNNNDIWFVGFTPYYTAGVWGGCDNNQKLTARNGGTSFHKDIWKKIMNRVHEELPDPGFTVPDSVTTEAVCRKSGKLSVSGLCSQDARGNAAYTEYFAKDNVPTEVCDKHVRVTVCSVSGLLPKESCPKSTRIRIAVPEDSDGGTTDDSPYAMPDYYCDGHTSVTLDEEEEGSQSPSSEESAAAQAPGRNNTSRGPGYVSGSQAPSAAGNSGSGVSLSNGPGRD